MTITLPCFNIVIELGPEVPGHAGSYQGGKITSDLKGSNRLCQAAMDAIESVLATLLLAWMLPHQAM